MIKFKYHKSIEIFHYRLKKYKDIPKLVFVNICSHFNLPYTKILKILLHYNVKQFCFLYEVEPHMGYYDSFYKKIVVNLLFSKNKQLIINTIFHELGHHYCYQNNKWPTYHYTKSDKNITKKDIRNFNRTAIKAEKWVDNWAEKEQKKWFPNLPFEKTLEGPDFDKNFFHETYMKHRIKNNK